MSLNISIKEMLKEDLYLSPKNYHYPCYGSSYGRVIKKLTSDHYTAFDGEIDEEYEYSIKAAKYIMEFLYYEADAVVRSNGYSLKAVKKHIRFQEGAEKSIFDLSYDLMTCCVMIDEILQTMYHEKTDTVEIVVGDDFDVSFLDWVEKTSLKGTVNILKLLREKDIVSGNYNFKIYRYKDKQIYCDRTDMAALTPEREARSFENYRKYDMPPKETICKYPSAIQIKRDTYGKISIKILSIVKYPNNEELYDDIMSEITEDPINECIVIVYDRENIPERFVYSKRSNYYRAFRYSKGRLRRIRKDDAFERFHAMYLEMTQQTEQGS